jgi:transcriptional regulator with XRE-family HTH domain
VINPTTLRHHRTLAGLSQRGLAKAAGLGPLGIKRIEDGADAGRLPLAVVGRMADAVGVTIDQLLDQPPAPAGGTSGTTLPNPEPLTYNQAKLLRRLHRGEDITRRMTRADRELTLPSMMRQGVIDVAEATLCIRSVDRSLDLNCVHE